MENNDIVQESGFTEDQKKAIVKIQAWFRKTNSDSFFTMGGYAGTGKSFIIPYIIEALGLDDDQVAIAAFTGKASLVLQRKRLNATTIHRLMYYPEVKKNKDNKEEVVWRKKHKIDDNIKLIIIDEASMVSENIHYDLLSYRKKILYIGDCFQLPPVNSTFSLMDEKKINHKLNQICRQAEGNSIIQISHNIRNNIHVPIGDYGNVKKININNMSYKDLLYYDQIICGTNKNRVLINNIIRKLKGYNDLLHKGEKLIVVSNNYNIGVINGQQIYVENFKLNKHNISVTYRDDYESTTSMAEMSYLNIRENHKEDIKSNKKIYADYGYCITAHKGQGSEWPKVAVYDDGFGFDDEIRRRWAYTAITRGKEEVLWIVNR